MPKSSKVNISCDLCKHPEKQYDSESEAKENDDWIEITSESFYDDRSFQHLWVCSTCSESIKRELMKNGHIR